jgi:transposase-like protein
MTVREIQRFLKEQYKVEVSVDLISTVTDSATDDLAGPRSGARPNQRAPTE